MVTGGKVAGSVSKRTSFVVAGEAAGSSEQRANVRRREVAEVRRNDRVRRIECPAISVGEQVLLTHPPHRERLDGRAERAQRLDLLTQERMRDRRVTAHDVREPRRWILRFVALVRDGRIVG